MALPSKRLAIIFDFDETLTNDSTSALLKSQGVDVTEFWDVKVKKLINQGFDPTEAYMMQMVKEMRQRGKLEQLRDRNLNKFGSTLTFYPGVTNLFDELRALVDDRVRIQFFVISGGFQEIIAGSSIANELDDFWGCTYHWDRALGIPYPKNAVSFTEKTKHLFQINKGLIGSGYKNKPYEVNEFMESRARHIPLENMIYVGDGLTDVPCFSLLDQNKGHPICVFNERLNRREGLQRAIKATRHRSVMGPYRADYQRGSEIRVFIEHVCEEFVNS